MSIDVYIIKDAVSSTLANTLLNSDIPFRKYGVQSGYEDTSALSLSRRCRGARLLRLAHPDIFAVIDSSFEEAYLAFGSSGHYDASKTTLDILKYTANDLGHFDWHVDAFKDSPDENRRQFTLIITLDDDYEGGVLCLPNKQFDPPVAGTCFIFPSDMLHKVTPVTKGTRHSLVAWAISKVS